MFNRKDALDYHREGRAGKIEISCTKPTLTQRDLSLAYTPEVAQPCLDIAKNPEMVDEYTARANLVAVVTNGCQSRETQPELTDGGITLLLRRIIGSRATSRTRRSGSSA